MRIRLLIARLLNRLCRGACWVHLYQWANGDIAWGDIQWDCRDMEDSGCDRCWCGKHQRCCNESGARR